MNANRTVTAHFTRTYTLTASASPSGGGSVSGGGTHDAGTNVTVTATPNSGYRFDRWSGDCTGTGACSVTMNANRTVTAHFVARYTLTASASPSGGGSVSGGGTYDAGTNVTVTATPNSGYRLERWSGACTGTGACTVTMSANRTVTAHFVRVYTLSTSASPSGGGSVSGGGTHDAGTNVRVTASANGGYRFDRWSGACTGSGACTVAMSADRSVTAHFVRRYTLTASASPPTAGSVSGGGAYDAGTSVTVTARPNAGFAFERWLGDCTGTEACSVTMNANRSVTALFTAIPGANPLPDPAPTPTSPGPPGDDEGGRVGLAVTSRVRGAVPEKPSFHFRYTCRETGGASVTDTFSLDPDETHRFLIEAALPCTLTVIDGEDAASVSGRSNSFPVNPAFFCVFSLDGDTGNIFADRTFSVGEYTAEVIFAWVAGTPVDIRLARGFTFTAWPGNGAPVAEALLPVASVVTAVYSWDAAGQRWDNWFPNADGLGVNTFSSLRTGGIYVVSAAAPRTWRVEVSEAWQTLPVVRLVRGFTFIAWPGDHGLAIGEALGSLARRQHNRQSAVTAVYFWDAGGQRWLNWFPDAATLGVNTLVSFQQRGIYGFGGIYVISAGSGLDWRVRDDAIIVGPGIGSLPTC